MIVVAGICTKQRRFLRIFNENESNYEVGPVMTWRLVWGVPRTCPASAGIYNSPPNNHAKDKWLQIMNER